VRMLGLEPKTYGLKVQPGRSLMFRLSFGSLFLQGIVKCIYTTTVPPMLTLGAELGNGR